MDDDSVSVQSFGAAGGLESKSTSVERKSKRSMRKMSSLVNMFSPSNNRVGRALEVSGSHTTIAVRTIAMRMYIYICTYIRVLPCLKHLFGGFP